MLCLRCHYDGAFFGWLILGSSAGLLLDGVLMNRTLRTAAVGIVPLMISLAATVYFNAMDSDRVEPEAIAIAVFILWIECLFVVMLLLAASSVLGRILKAFASAS